MRHRPRGLSPSRFRAGRLIGRDRNSSAVQAEKGHSFEIGKGPEARLEWTRRLAEGLGPLVATLDAPVRTIFLIAGRNAVGVSRVVASCAPTAAVHLVTPNGLPDWAADRLPGTVRVHEGRDVHAFARTLLRIPQPDLIIDAQLTTEHRALHRLRRLVWFIAPGGGYVIRFDGPSRRAAGDGGGDVVAAIKQLVAPHQESETSRPTPDAELSAACASLSVSGDFAMVRKRFAHRYRIRDRDANAILDVRFGSVWGEVVATRPAAAYASRAIYVEYGTRSWHGQGAPPTAGTLIEVPDLRVRRYANVTAWHGQRLARDGFWLPDTFRHPLNRSLSHERLVRGNAGHSRLPEGVSEQPRPLAGSFYYFDTEYPGHFGHVLTEVVSRHWGWQRARALDPSVRPLLSQATDEHPLPGFQRKIFEALDVPVDQAEFIAPAECVQVESLYAAGPMFSMPHYAAPELADVWASIARSVKREGATTPRRLFVTRHKKQLRTCLNTEEVEDFFRELGFTTYYPELHEFADQVTAFAQADIIAGFAGSGMFSMMYAPDTPVILISGASYSATNEFLIASVHGTRLHNFLGESEIQHPPGRWGWDAYLSNFRFDLARFGAQISAAVEDEPARPFR